MCPQIMWTKCGQNVDKTDFLTILLPFWIFVFLQNPYKIRLYAFLPQHCLYFLPLPHAVKSYIFYVLSILYIFPLFTRFLAQGTFNIICIYKYYFYYVFSHFCEQIVNFLTYCSLFCSSLLYIKYSYNTRSINNILQKFLLYMCY